MSRKSRRIKAGEEPPSPKEEKTSLAWLGIPAATLREWHRAREALDPVLDKALARVLQRAQGLPRSREEQEEDFTELGIPPTVYGTLWEWGATTEAVEQVLEFLKRVNFWWGAHKATIELANRVYGRARDPHNNRPEELGEIAEFQMARTDLVAAIDRFVRLHLKTIHAYDPAIALSLPHLEAVLDYLKQYPEIEVDPTLPGRTRGRKPAMKFAFREGEPPRRVRRRDIERALQNLLLPLHPRGSKPDAKFLAQKLLDPLL